MIEIRSIKDIVRLFYIFRREFLYGAATTLLIAVLGALFLPKRFESQAQLLIKPATDQQIAPPVNGGNTNFQPSTQRDPVLDEQLLLTSWPVVQQVAAAYLHALAQPPAPGLWAHAKYYLGRSMGAMKEGLRRILVGLGILDAASPLDRAVRDLSKSFSVGHESGSNIIDISIRWSDPIIAQALNKQWIDAYFDAHAKATGAAQLYAFYQQQSAQLGRHIQDLKQQIRQRLAGMDTRGVQQQLDSIGTQLQRLRQQRQDAVDGGFSTQALLRSASAQLDILPAETINSRQISLNPTKQDLRLKLNSLQEQRITLLRTYQPGAPPIREIEQSIKAMQTALAQTTDVVQLSKNLSPNAIAAKLRQDIADGKNQVARLQGMQASLEAQINELQQERSQVLAIEPALNRLSLQLNAAEQTFTRYTDYLLHISMARDLNTKRLNDVRLVEPPTFMPARTFPKTMLILLLAPVAALAVGAFTIFLCHLLDLRIHDGKCVQTRLQQCLWATLPELGKKPSASVTERFEAGLQHILQLLPHERLHEKGLRVALTSCHSDEDVRFISQRLVAAAKSSGYHARLAADAEPPTPAAPGELLFIAAKSVDAALMTIQLRAADIRLLLIAAHHTDLTQAQHAVELLQKLFGAVDGLILCRQRLDIPVPLRQWLRRSPIGSG